MTRAHFVHLNQKPYTVSLPISLSILDFWRDFEVFWHQLLKENIPLSLQDILVGMIRQNSPSPNLLNYLIMIGKLYLWDCRTSQILPNIYGFKKKIALKYETGQNSLHSKNQRISLKLNG